MAKNESSIDCNSSTSHYYHYYSTHFAQLSHNADLLRQPRRCQLLLPSYPQPTTEGHACLRYLWVYRATQRQAIPSVRRMRALTQPSPISLIALTTLFSDVMQMTTNYCVSSYYYTMVALSIANPDLSSFLVP